MTSEQQLTVGALRAELVGWPDGAVLVVCVPDPADPHAVTVLPVSAAGSGSGLEAGSDPILNATFELRVTRHTIP